MDPIETCATFLLAKAYQHVNAAAKQRLAQYGVTPTQYAVLRVLWERDGQSGAQLADRLQFDSATTTGLLDRLANAGLLERRADATDRRVHRIFLTEQGRKLEEPLGREVDALNAECFGQFRAPDAERLVAMLAELGHVEVPA